jgi:hypothetical protein
MQEEWKYIHGYDNRYQVSNFGRVRSLRGRHNKPYREPLVLSATFDGNGYLKVNLYCKQKLQSRTVHSLVAESFIGTRPINHDVNHIDGNKSNNNLNNLEYLTKSKNKLHAISIGLIDTRKYRSNNKVSIDNVKIIKQLISEGRSDRQIGDMFKIHKATVNDIRHNKTWKEVQ